MKKILPPRFAFVSKCLLAAGCLHALGFAAQSQTDLQTLKQRLFTYHTTHYSTSSWWSEPNAATVDAYFTSIGSDGSWSATGTYHLNYADNGGGIWEPMIHVARLEAMAAAVKRPGSNHYNVQADINKVLAGLNYILNGTFTSTSSYHLGIAWNIPMKGISILMESHLTQAQKDKIATRFHYLIKDVLPSGAPDGVYEYYYSTVGTAATGQNLNWLAGIHLYSALLKNSTTETAAAIATIKSLATPATGSLEGLKLDSSFFQHGPQLQNAAYGSFFGEDMARYLRMFKDLPSYAFNTTQTQALRNYILDGQQWMIRRNNWDTHALGRQLAEKNETKPHALMPVTLQDMKAGDPSFAPSYQAILDHNAGSNDAALAGNKHFFRGDYTAHRRAGYSFHTRMSSTRTSITETGNLENIQNEQLAQGGNSLLLNGDEYLNIFPCWRWDRIPGTTSPQRTASELKTTDWSVPGTKTFVGGVSNGTYGASAKDLQWDAVTGKKAWFYFDDDIVCLGAGIASTSGREIFTTLNQTLRKSNAYYELGTGSGTLVPSGTTSLSPKWVHHGNAGYVFLNNANAEVRDENITGNWYSINQNTYPNPTNETKQRFMLAVKHGINPTAASYAYAILPAHDLNYTRAYYASPQSRILSNTTTLQAVRNDVKKVASLIFWSIPASPVTLSPELKILVNKPCMVLVDESATPTKVSVASYQADTVQVTLDYTSSSDVVQNFTLLGGDSAGKSVTQTHTSGSGGSVLVDDAFADGGVSAGADPQDIAWAPLTTGAQLGIAPFAASGNTTHALAFNSLYVSSGPWPSAKGGPFTTQALAQGKTLTFLLGTLLHTDSRL